MFSCSSEAFIADQIQTFALVKVCPVLCVIYSLSLIRQAHGPQPERIRHTKWETHKKSSSDWLNSPGFLEIPKIALKKTTRHQLL